MELLFAECYLETFLSVLAAGIPLLGCVLCINQRRALRCASIHVNGGNFAHKNTTVVSVNNRKPQCK